MNRGSYTGPLEARYHPDREEWEVITEFWFQTGEDDHIKIPVGFFTDLASTKNIPFFPQDDEYNQAAVVHDYLYAAELVPRRVSDIIFKEALRAIPQVPRWKIPIMYFAVRVFGGITYKSHTFESVRKNRMLSHIPDSGARPLWKDGLFRFI